MVLKAGREGTIEWASVEKARLCGLDASGLCWAFGLHVEGGCKGRSVHGG